MRDENALHISTLFNFPQKLGFLPRCHASYFRALSRIKWLVICNSRSNNVWPEAYLRSEQVVETVSQSKHNFSRVSVVLYQQ